MAKGFSDLRMHRIDQCLGQFSGYSFGEDCVYIEQREIGGMTNVCWNTYCINQQRVLIGSFCVESNLLIGWACGSASMAAVVIVISRCRSTDHFQAMTYNSFIAVIHHRFRQPLPEIHHHRWVKWSRLLKAFQANEELEVRVFFDLLNEFFIRDPQAGFDDQST